MVIQCIDVLFLCETNCATSLMAEALLNRRSDGRIRAFSAGNRPGAVLLPEARAALAQRAIPIDGLAPKPWQIFGLPDGPRPHIVVDLATLTWIEPDCARLAQVLTLRWPLRDPALVDRHAERLQVTEAVFGALSERISSELMRRIDGVRHALDSGAPPSLARRA